MHIRNSIAFLQDIWELNSITAMAYLFLNTGQKTVLEDITRMLRTFRYCQLQEQEIMI